MSEPTNRLHYPGDIIASLGWNQLHGADSTGYPYQVLDARYDPGTDTTTVDLQPWPVDDMAGIEQVVRERRAEHAERARIVGVFR